MSNTILTLRVPEDLAEWLAETSRRTGVPVGRLFASRSKRRGRSKLSGRSCAMLGRFAGPETSRPERAFPVEANCTGEQLADSYEDRNPDLADLCIVRMSELYPKHVVVTVDSDFRVHRRNKREPIPLLLPRGRE
jgi:hypothetical protein